MSNHKKFDDYIRGLFDRDPKVPSELGWDEMNFDLPDTAKQNGKVDRRKYIGLLLLFLITISIIYFSTNTNKITAPQSATQLTEQPSEDKTTPNIVAPIEQKNENTSTSNNIQKEANPSIAKQLSDDSKSPKTIIDKTEQKNQNTAISNKVFVEKSPSNIRLVQAPATSIAEQNNNQFKPVSNDDFLKNSFEYNTTPITNYTDSKIKKPIKSAPFSTRIIDTNSSQNPTVQTIEYLSTIQMSSLPTSNKSTLLPSPALSEMNYVDNSPKFSIEEVYIGYGLNNFNVEIDTSSILKDNIDAALGASLSASVRFRLSENWMTNLGLKYDKYHSTFEHFRDLAPIYDLENLVKIYRTERTFHNNYTNALNVQLGLERRLRVSKHLQLYAGFGIAPTYAISAIGKTTTDTMVDELTYDNQVSRFSLSGGASAGMIIPINRSINLEAAYQYNQFLFNGIFINNGISTKQQSAISLMISYKLNK